jgi:hypothetical protein
MNNFFKKKPFHQELGYQKISKPPKIKKESNAHFNILKTKEIENPPKFKRSIRAKPLTAQNLKMLTHSQFPKINFIKFSGKEKTLKSHFHTFS